MTKLTLGDRDSLASVTWTETDIRALRFSVAIGGKADVTWLGQNRRD
jgi:hypothetical protein